MCVCVSVEVSVCKCKCRSVSVQGIFRKNPSQCFRELTLQVSQTSVSYETSSKSHTSKSPKRVFRTRLPPKVSGKVERSTHTHQAALPSSFAIPAAPNNTRSHGHTPIPMSQRHSPPPQLATSRAPAPATKIRTSFLHVLSTLPSTKIIIRAETCHEQTASQQLA